jgi:hypothetical protein
MTVHSFHIFDRRGKTLFTKRYVPKKNNNKDEDANKNDDEAEEERLSEQRKLVFGMLYSLRELSSSLSPVDGPGDLQFMKTGASNVYNYETVSGLRFVLYTTNNDITSRPTTNTNSTNPTTGSSATSTPQSSSHGNPTTNPTLVGGPTSTGLINSATAATNPSVMNNMNDSNSSSIHGNTTTGTTNPTQTANIRSSLKYIYEHIWVAYVIRSPMYQPNCNNKDNDNAIKSTNFEVTLDNYLKGMTWYR